MALWAVPAEAAQANFLPDERHSVEIVILGSGTGYPNPRRFPPGLLVRVGECPILFDAGSGTLHRLLRAGVDAEALEYVCFTHAHADHCGDLIPMLQAFALVRRTRPLHVLGSPGFLAYMRAMLDLNPWARPSSYELREVDTTQGEFGGPGWTVDTAPSGHMPESLAFRLHAEGKTLVYTGDAIPDARLATFARGADVFIAECSFPDDLAEPCHLTPTSAGTLAEEAGAKHLVLTHFYPPCERVDVAAVAAKVYSGKITVAQDGMTLRV